MKQTLKTLFALVALVLSLAVVFSCGRKSASEPAAARLHWNGWWFESWE